jgi:biotin carboxylase
VPHGLLHAEFMLAGSSGDPVAVLLDVAARGGGVLIYQQVIPHVSGVDLMAAAIHLAMGQPVSLQPLSQRRGGCIEFVQVPAGDFVALEGLESGRSVPGVVAVHVNAKPGQRQGPARHKDDRPAYVVALAETAAGALRSAQSAKGMLHVHMGDAAKAAPVF